MANNYWLGTKDAEGQIDTLQVTLFDASTTYNITINGVVVGVVGDTDIATTADNLAVALEASTNPYFTSVDWVSDGVDTVTGTSSDLGMPWTGAGSVVGGTGTITYTAEVTAATGPNHWDEAENWSTGTAPVSTDAVIIENSAINIRWGLDQNAITLASMIIRKSYTGKIGLKSNQVATSADGETTDETEVEYRDLYLRIGITDLAIGENLTGVSQSGSTLIKIDTVAVATTINVFDTGSSSDETGKPGIQLLTANASAQLFIREGSASVGLAVGKPFETSTIQSIEIGDEMDSGGVNVGPGVTITTFKCKSGTHFLQSAGTITTVEIDGGTVSSEGDYLITTVTVANAGLYNSNHINSGGNAITTMNINLNGELNTLGNSEPRTFGTLNISVGGTLSADKDILTVTTFEEPSGKYTLVASAP